MPFVIIRNDITKVAADAVVNTANPHARIGAGTDSAVYKAAGAQELLAERKKIGEIPVGKAAATSAFRLPAKYIIHTVGPVWTDGTHGEPAALRSCYEESLKLARELLCESVAFPLIATGMYGFPKDLALRIATSAIFDFLMDNDMTIYLVVYDRKAYDLSGKLFQDVKAYIDENYVSQKREEAYSDPAVRGYGREAELRELRRGPGRNLSGEAESGPLSAEPARPAAESASLAEILKDTDVTFQECLLKLIIERDLKNSDVYHGANLSKQHFSKLISNKNYHPTKNTACALALSLHLSLPEAAALLEKAGFVLSKSSRFDLVMEYFFLNGMYNIMDDNIVLDENDLEILGAK